MSERRISPGREAICTELDQLIESGYVLRIKDVRDVAEKHGFARSTVISVRYFFDYRRPSMHDPNLIEEKFKGRILLRDKRIPLEDTDYHEVVREINARIGARTILRLDQEHPGLE